MNTKKIIRDEVKRLLNDPLYDDSEIDQYADFYLAGAKELPVNQALHIANIVAKKIDKAMKSI